MALNLTIKDLRFALARAGQDCRNVFLFRRMRPAEMKACEVPNDTAVMAEAMPTDDIFVKDILEDSIATKEELHKQKSLIAALYPHIRDLISHSPVVSPESVGAHMALHRIMSDHADEIREIYLEYKL